MYTACYELYRRPELTQAEFVSYWLDTHKPIAMRMPLVRGYEIWPVSDSEAVEGESVAGFVVLRFDSREDFETCHESPEFAATADDAMNFARHFTRYEVTEHKVI